MRKESNFPKLKNSAFLKAIASNYPSIKLEFKREEGYSIYLNEIPEKRWIMVDINDSEKHGRPHLVIVIDIKSDNFDEEFIEGLTKLPYLKSGGRPRKTGFRINKNRDAIELQFCMDELKDYDFEDENFLKFIEKTRVSFIER